MSHEEYYFNLAYTLFYTRLENNDELLSRVKRDILKDYIDLYKTIDPIELFENIVIDQDNCFSILYENFEYKFQITSYKLKEKILNTSDNQKLFDLIRSSAQNITSFSLTKLV